MLNNIYKLNYLEPAIQIQFGIPNGRRPRHHLRVERGPVGKDQGLSLVACICQRSAFWRLSQRIRIHGHLFRRQHEEVSSRLGPSKLRKFPEHYAECYAKVKTNKKLKQSIERAEERLKQNHQDVSIYEGIRNQLRTKKKKSTVSQQRLSSSQKCSGIDAPELIKNKTCDPNSNRARTKKPSSQVFQQSQSQQQKSEQSQKSKSKDSRKIITVLNRRGSQNNRRNNKQSPSRNVPIEPIYEEKVVTRTRRNLRGRKISQSQQEQPQKQNNSNEDNSKMQVQQKEEPKSKRKIQEEAQESHQSKQKQRTSSLGRRKGRKGRPTRQEQLLRQKQRNDQDVYEQVVSQKQSQKSPEPVQQSSNRRAKKKPAPKVTTKPENVKKQPRQAGELTELQTESIKKCLNNRRQLTKLLLQLPITTTNVKQILDLGVSLALQEGPTNKTTYMILCMLKTTLLHKYFPDDNKHRKKYERIMKEKKKFVYQSDDENENDSKQEDVEAQSDNDNARMEQQPIDEPTNSKTEEKTKTPPLRKKQKQEKSVKSEVEESKLKQIRAKAITKLQKMIRRSGLEEGAREFAFRLENTFQQSAQTKGDLYRNIAFERMRNVKTTLARLGENKSQSYQIKSYLENLLQAYENEAMLRTEYQ